MSDSVRPHRRQPTRLPRPCDSPGKNAGVGCHFLLQCMKVKSESEVAQSSLTLSDPMDCSLPGSSVHGIFQARVMEWVAIVFSNKALGNFKNYQYPSCCLDLLNQKLRFPGRPQKQQFVKVLRQFPSANQGEKYRFNQSLLQT